MPTVLTERSVFITPVWLHTLILSGCQFQSLLEDIYYFLPTASGGQNTDGVLHKYQYLCLKMLQTQKKLHINDCDAQLQLCLADHSDCQPDSWTKTQLSNQTDSLLMNKPIRREWTSQSSYQPASLKSMIDWLIHRSLKHDLVRYYMFV